MLKKERQRELTLAHPTVDPTAIRSTYFNTAFSVAQAGEDAKTRASRRQGRDDGGLAALSRPHLALLLCHRSQLLKLELEPFSCSGFYFFRLHVHGR